MTVTPTRPDCLNRQGQAQLKITAAEVALTEAMVSVCKAVAMGEFQPSQQYYRRFAEAQAAIEALRRDLECRAAKGSWGTMGAALQEPNP